MPDELLQRLRRFHDDAFPQYRAHFRELVDGGQHPTTLFIGCSDSRLVPYLLTGAGPGELFMVRNVGALVPPCCGTLAPRSQGRFGMGSSCDDGTQDRASRWTGGLHGTAAAIEFAVLNLKVRHIVVCGHSHCGAMRALYQDLPPESINLGAWLELAREAVLPVRLFDTDMPAEPPPEDGVADPGDRASGLRPEVLRRTEQRSVVLQLERLMDYPMVRRRVERGELSLHGWHYVIEDGEVHVFDVHSGGFVPASLAEHSDTGAFPPGDDSAWFNEIDASLAPPATV